MNDPRPVPVFAVIVPKSGERRVVFREYAARADALAVALALQAAGVAAHVDEIARDPCEGEP